MLKSVQFKIVIVYSLLILFAIQVFAVFLTQSMERYYLNSFTQNLEHQGLLLAGFLERYLISDEEREASEAIDALVLEYSLYGGTTAIMVLDSLGRVISSSDLETDWRGQRIIQEEINRALAGSRGEIVRVDPLSNERIIYLALPVRSGDNTLGVVYLMGSLEPIYETLREIQFMLVTGALLVIAITVLLGIVLAKTITGPIAEVTKKAAQIAEGDYKQKINIHSQDELGKLGEMFNYLSTQLEQTLREISSEKGKVEAMLNHMTDGIVALHRDGQILHVNPAACKLLRVKEKKDLTATMLEQLIGDIDLNDLLNEGRRARHELYLEEQHKSISVNYVPFHMQEASDRGFFGVLLVIHDMTQERELIRIQQEFVANVSHELRTPLTTLKSYTETLLGGAMNQPDVCLTFLTTMEKETERMVRLVKDLLALSQMDYRQMSWRKELWRIDEIITEVVEELSVKNGQSRQVGVNLPEDPIFYNLDRDKIKQVLINVIQNAFKYTSETGKIEVSLEHDEGHVVIIVRDNGIGIPPEEIHKVFERFYRVDKARSRDFGGTGLGLPIAKEIVEAHGGTIEMQSEQNYTQVIIRLPKTQIQGGQEECLSI